MVKSVSKKVKKIDTKKKGIMSVDELNAYKLAYGSGLDYSDIMKNVISPGLLLAGFSFILLYYWWVSLIFFLIGSLYGWRKLLPKVVKRNYELAAFEQRNQWINLMTLLLTDPSRTIPQALEAVSILAEGEFANDLQVLDGYLYGADNSRIQEGFRQFSERYTDDVIFLQYVEQLETAAVEGKTNVDTLKDIKTYHNELNVKQRLFRNAKQRHFDSMKGLVGLIVTVLLAMNFLGVGFETFLNVFSRHPIGLITTIAYLAISMKVSFSYMKVHFDDSVLEITA